MEGAHTAHAAVGVVRGPFTTRPSRSLYAAARFQRGHPRTKGASWATAAGLVPVGRRAESGSELTRTGPPHLPGREKEQAKRRHVSIIAPDQPTHEGQRSPTPHEDAVGRGAARPEVEPPG